MKVALVVGHTEKRSGARNKLSGISEFMFNYLLASKLRSCLPDSVVVLRDSWAGLPYKVNLQKPDLIVSLHCNAFNSKASGTETLYFHKSEKGLAVAEIFQKHLVAALQLPDRGVQPKTQVSRGGSLLRKTIAPCIILEPFFIDNDADFDTACVRETELIKAVLTAVKECEHVVV